jgi:hypothetical protein
MEERGYRKDSPAGGWPTSPCSAVRGGLPISEDRRQLTRIPNSNAYAPPGVICGFGGL